MNRAKIKEIVEELLKKMGIRFDSVEEVVSPETKNVRFLVRSAESPLLIGASGEHLGAFNYIAKRIISKIAGEEILEKFVIDVNGYYEKNLENLKAVAKIMSERARSFKTDVELPPMSSYERMFVHTLLEGLPDIKTESKGEGAQRRVVIKYIVL